MARWIRGLQIAWHGMRRHPLRTALAAVTTAVAVAVTANVISLSQGMDRDIKEDTEQFGQRTVDLVRAPLLGTSAARTSLTAAHVAIVQDAFKDQDVTVVPRRHLLRTVYVPDEREKASAEAPWRAIRGTTVVLAPGALQRTMDVPLLAGRWWRSEEAAAGARVAVIDASIARRIQRTRGETPSSEGAAALVGRVVRLGEDPASWTVVGVLADPLRYRALFEELDAGKSTRMLGSSILSFRNVYVAPSAGAHLAGDAPTDVTGVSLVAGPGTTVDAVEAESVRLAQTLHQDAGAPFLATISRRTWMRALGEASSSGAFIGHIVWLLIALVAALLIATMNLVSVRERYDEFAVRRVEGARRSDVAAQVVAESVSTSLIGGLLGLPLGVVGASVLSRLAAFPFRMDMRYAGWVLLIAVTIGALASLLPAWRAASLDPARVLTRRMR